MDIFLSLVQLLQQTSSTRSSDQLAKIMDKGAPTFANYQHSPMSIPISLADRLQWSKPGISSRNDSIGHVFHNDGIPDWELCPDTKIVNGGVWSCIVAEHVWTWIRMRSAALTIRDRIELTVYLRSASSVEKPVNFRCTSFPKEWMIGRTHAWERRVQGKWIVSGSGA